MKTPDEILNQIHLSESKKNKGKLKIFFGMSPGVGKTYSMLQYAKTLHDNGKNVLIGFVETHGRKETLALTSGLKLLARKKILYKDTEFEEFDLEKALELKPEYVVVDELAHTNISGMKHSKRYHDVLELIDNGINVLTAINVQHIESRSKTVEQITGIKIQETVPDLIIDSADEIELIDIPIEELQKRLREGKVYFPDKIESALQNFFQQGNLISLREMALRLTAEKVDSDLIEYMHSKNINGPWKANDKLMVAVGPSPFSAELIKWTRRMAYSFKCQWVAVYIDTNISKTHQNNEQLEKNLKLAKELGAEVITITGFDFVDTILQLARKLNISQIVIGKPAKYNILNYINKNNYIDRLIQESGNIDIYIIRPTSINPNQVKKQSSFKLNTPLNEYFYAILSVVCVASICYPFSHILGYQSIGLILLLNLLILPFYTGRGAIISASLFNFFIWNFFFIPPIFTFSIDKLQDILTLILNLLIALTSGILASKIRKQKMLVDRREQNTLILLDFTKELAKCKNKKDVYENTIKFIEEQFKCKTLFLNVEQLLSNEGIDTLISSKELIVAKWCFEHNKVAGIFTDNLPSVQFQFLPIASNKKKLGVFCLGLKSKLILEDENLLSSIISQMAIMYEKEESQEKYNEMIVSQESNKLYNTLFDSISHEFRTPIAVISGYSTSLLDENINKSKALVKELGNEIYIASKRLDNLVENLLDITRLESGSLKLNLKLCNINDLLNDVIAQLQENSKHHIIQKEFNLENPLIMIDYGFVSQAIFNILHNALIYTPIESIIKIKTYTKNFSMHVEISDNGKGLTNKEISKLFTKFYRADNSQTGGTGLGLSIAKGFIEAHNGKIEVFSNNPNGLVFDIELTYEK